MTKQSALEKFEYLKGLKLDLVTDGAISGIRFSDVPADLFAEFEAFMVGSAYPVISGLPCAYAGDWERFRRRKIAEVGREQHVISLRAAMAGPKPDELAAAPVISCWVALRYPVFSGSALIGNIESHPNSLKPPSQTSRLCGINLEKSWARTFSRWYRLGEPGKLDELARQFGPVLKEYAPLQVEMDELQNILAQDRRTLLGN